MDERIIIIMIIVVIHNAIIDSIVQSCLNNAMIFSIVLESHYGSSEQYFILLQRSESR